MKARTLFVPVGCLLTIAAMAQEPPRFQSDPPIACDACDAWNAKREPFHIFGNTYYVGVAGLSSILIVSEQGHILLDGGLPQSAAAIDANIRALGFRTRDVRLIVASHEHYDHVGGIRALQRASGATVAASPPAARGLKRGEPTPEDPQYGFGREANRFPPVGEVRDVADGETLRAGDLAVTARFTPGHTPGSTTWTWRACEGTRGLDVVYADSLNAVAAPGFRYAAAPAMVERFRRSIALVRNAPCDILLTVHPDFAQLSKKAHQRAEGASQNPFVDPSACRSYAEAAAQGLDKRLASEPTAP